MRAPKHFAVVLGFAVLLSGCQWQKFEKEQPAPPPAPVVKQAPWLEIFPVGTVLVSRNKIEAQNTSPGYWNHLAVYVGRNIVVESQESAGGVIATSLQDYLARDYIWFPLFPVDLASGEKAAAKAQSLVGLPYRQISSMLQLDRKEEKGANCVSVAKISYRYADGDKAVKSLHKPDDAEHLSILTKTDPRMRK
jgi:hypothetical protein